MRKIISTVLTVMVLVSLFAGCAAKEVNKTVNQYKDGEYFAAMPNFDEKGFKYFTTFKVTDGKINSVVFDCVSKSAKETKTDLVKAGNYPMVASGKAQAEWDVQAKTAADYLVTKQDPTVTFDAEGKTDEIAGVSIHVNDFFALAKQALDAGPTTRGQYATDGAKHAESADFDDKGWKATVDIYVKNGNIVAANWDALNEKGDSKTKYSEEGKYGMVANSKPKAQAEWHVQATKAEEFLILKQKPEDITLNNEGITDAVAGVSIHVGEFVTLAKEALSK